MVQARGSTPLRILLCLLLVLPAFAWGEAPSRDELRESLLVTRTSLFHNPWDESYGGIWQLDRDTLEYRRHRPFLATNYPGTDGPRGEDGFLSAHGDLLTYRTWPGLVDIDVFSWRMVRRRPTSADPSEIGWVVQGPTLTLEDAGILGLEPGTYGIGRCVLWIITGGGESGWRSCEPSPFPGMSEPNEYGTDAAVLWREPPPEERATRLFAPLEPYDWEHAARVNPCLSFDWGRHGLWRCRPTGAVLYPVTSEGLEAQTVDHELTFPPFDSGNVEVQRLFYLPAADRLFGTAMTLGIHDVQYFFFSLDAENGDGQVLESWDEGADEGTPAALAALGESPREHVQLIPIIADTPGANGTQWSTELWFFNPSAQPMHVRLQRVTQPDETHELILPAHGSLGRADALAWLGGGAAGDGTTHEAVVVTSDYHWGEQLVVAGRLSTPDPETGGRYGHAVTAVPGQVGYCNHLPYSDADGSLYHVLSPGIAASHVDLDLREPGRYRYNLGVVNALDQPVTLRLIWGYAEWWEGEIGPVRPEELETELVVPGHGVELYALESLFPLEARQRWAPRIAVNGDQPAVVWLSMIDNLTGDATFIPFTSFQYYNDREEDRLVIPVVAHGPGMHGSEWRTDLFGYEYTGWNDEVFAVYHPAQRETQCGGTTPPEGIFQRIVGEVGIPLSVWAQTLRDGGVWVPWDDYAAIAFSMVFPDVVRQFTPCADEDNTKGALEIAIASWFSGYSRTYTTREDGGTYGSMLPLYPPGGWPVQHFAGLEVNPAQRVNVGLYNGNGESSITHRLLLYSEDGALAASRELTLAPFASYQRSLEQTMGLSPGSLAPGLYGLSVIPLDDPEIGLEGRSWAYVSLVDNASNDPVNLW